MTRLRTCLIVGYSSAILSFFSKQQTTGDFPALGGAPTNKTKPTNQNKAKPSKSKKEEVRDWSLVF